jgi:hypoxanthine phosphoribosyltransferase
MKDSVSINEMRFVKMIGRKTIAQRIRKLADDINNEYRYKEVEIIIVLKGAFIFAADLIRHFKFAHNISFIQFSSYKGTESTGTITERFPIQIDATGKDILIIEDIVDTGNTLNYFIEKLKKSNPNSVEIASLLFKKEAYKHDFPVQFVAFEIENKFVIGFGLDLDEKARNLKHIYQLEE